MSKTNPGSGGGCGGGAGSGGTSGHTNPTFVSDEQVFSHHISNADKKKFAIEINEKDMDYDPYKNRIVKAPTT